MYLLAFQNTDTDLILTRSDIKLFPFLHQQRTKKKALEIIAHVNCVMKTILFKTLKYLSSITPCISEPYELYSVCILKRLRKF